LRKLLLAKNAGSVESFLTIAPQVFIFLIMFQLVFIQFNLMRDTHIYQSELTKNAISGGGKNYARYPLIGGGSVLLLENRTAAIKFIDFTQPAIMKVVSIAVDENDSN